MRSDLAWYSLPGPHINNAADRVSSRRPLNATISRQMRHSISNNTLVLVFLTAAQHKGASVCGPHCSMLYMNLDQRQRFVPFDSTPGPNLDRP